MTRYLATYKGHLLTKPKPTGGKAGKGHNKTSTVQIWNKGGDCVLHSVRYEVKQGPSQALTQAKKWIDRGGLRCCPHCKGTQGFTRTIHFGGYAEEFYQFNGELSFAKKHPADKVDDYVVCMDCGKTIDSDQVKIKE